MITVTTTFPPAASASVANIHQLKNGCTTKEGEEEEVLRLSHLLIQTEECAPQLERTLAWTALHLRQMAKEKDKNSEEERQQQEEEEEELSPEESALWARIRALVQFGVSDNVRLFGWLEEMGRLVMKQRLSSAAAIRTIADRLEWVVLRLGLHSLPAICSPHIPRPQPSLDFSSPLFHAKVEASARVDLAGGWTDTPPITYQCHTQPAVLNLAIRVNGKRPLRCQCTRLELFSGVYYTEAGHPDRTLHFPDAAAVFAHCNRPSQPGSLLCSILVIAGIAYEELVGGERVRKFALGGPGRGLFVRTESDLPHGSGLGASSILSGAVLAALWRLCGKSFEHRELVHAVLLVEQLHTTGGGWQDQIGGCVPGGFKLGTVSPVGGRECLWRSVPVNDRLCSELPKRLALLYTGQTRLAKHLLQEVLLSWACRDERITRAVERLSDGARRAEQMLLEGLFPSSVCREYNELKKTFTVNTEPRRVTELVRQLTSEGLVDAAWMAGAGGGGFLYVWLAPGHIVDELEQFLAKDNRWADMSVWRAEMEVEEPMLMQ